MVELISKVFRLQAENLIPEVQIAGAILWVMLVFCSLTSVWGHADLSKFGKIAWSAAIFFLPLIGLLAYCAYCFSKLDMGFLEAFFSARDMKKVEHKAVAKR
jgi:hypothetical protein